MQEIHSSADLKAAILLLESRQLEEKIQLKEQFHDTYESIKPINLIKTTFREAAASHELKENMLSLSVSLTAGYLSQALFVRVSNNPLKKLLGTALLFGITNVVAKNPQAIQELGSAIFQLIAHKLNGVSHKKISETSS